MTGVLAVGSAVLARHTGNRVDSRRWANQLYGARAGYGRAWRRLGSHQGACPIAHCSAKLRSILHR